LSITVGTILNPMLEALIGLLTPILDVMGDFAEAHPGVVKAILGIALAFGSILIVATKIGPAIAVIAGAILSPITWLIGAIAVAVTVLVALIQQEIELMKGGWQRFLGNLRLIRDALVIVWNAVSAKAVQIWGSIRDFFVATWGKITAEAREIWATIKTVLVNIWDTISTKASEIWGTIKATVTGIWDTISTKASEIWGTIKTTITGLWDDISTAATAVWATIQTNLVTAWGSIKTTAVLMWDRVSGAVSQAWNSIMATLFPEDSLADKIGRVWGRVVGVVQSVFDDVKTAITSTFKGALNFIIDGINNITRWMSGIRFDFPGLNILGRQIIPSFGWGMPSLPQIPRMAKGGMITEPTLMYGLASKRFTGLAGEAGPEMVSPMGEGYRTANITLEIDGRTLARIIGQPLVDEIRITQGLRR